MTGFKASYRVYFEDTDAGGVMYHANYINFCERGRTEMLRACGMTNMGVKDAFGVLFVVRHIEVDYQKPLYLEDMVEVDTAVAQIKRSSIVLRQVMRKDRAVVCDVRVTLVCVDMVKMRPVRVPEAVRQKFALYQSNDDDV